MTRISQSGASVILSGLAALLAGTALLVVVMQASSAPQSVPPVDSGSETLATAGTSEDAPAPATSETSDSQIYTNELLNLAFAYPIGYTVREDISLAADREPVDYIEGDIANIVVVDQNEDIVFQVRAVSNDFSADTEGCCYYVRDPFDIRQTPEQLAVALDVQLDSVDGVEKITIDGRPSVAFYYTTRYVDTAFFRGAVTPMADGEFTNIFFTSAYLGKSSSDMDPSPPVVNIDTELAATYESILKTVTWLNP